MTQQQSTQVCEISKRTACAKVDELAMLVRRLVQSLRKAAPDNDLADQALDYLKRYGMGGTLLRDVPTNVPLDVPAGMKPSKAPEAAGTSPSASAPENVPALRAALEDAKAAINSMKVEAETAAQGDEQMMLEACEQISSEGLAASLAIDAVLGTCGLHQIAEPPHPMACSAEEVQAFEAAAAPAAVAVPNERAPSIQYDVLHEFATKHRADYNELCNVVRAALTDTPDHQAPDVEKMIEEAKAHAAKASRLTRVLLNEPTGSLTDTDIAIWIEYAQQLLNALAAAPAAPAPAVLPPPDMEGRAA